MKLIRVNRVPRLNRHILEKTKWDSDSITPLSGVLHRFEDPGKYQGQVLIGTRIVGRFTLVVDESYPQTALGVNLDEVSGSLLEVNPNSYTMFKAQRNADGFSVVVQQPLGKTMRTGFDSRKLNNGDIYLAAFLRPGRYSVTNQAGAKGSITVNLPKESFTFLQKRRMRFVSPKTISIECNDKMFIPDKMKTESGQAIAFKVKASNTRILIQLEAPDDKQKYKSRYRRRRNGKESTTVKRKLDTKTVKKRGSQTTTERTREKE